MIADPNPSELSYALVTAARNEADLVIVLGSLFLAAFLLSPKYGLVSRLPKRA